MSADGRYMYNSPSQAMATSYEYPAYQTSAYDTAQISQQHPHNSQQQAPSSSRQSTNMRVNSPAGHHPQPPPHTHSQYYTAPPPQPPQAQPSYPPPQAYSGPTHQPGMPPTGPGQWPADNWGHYSTSYGPPPIPDAAPTYSSGPARSEHPQPAAPSSQPVSQAQPHPSHQIHSQAVEQGRNSYVSGGPSPAPELRRAVPVPEERYSNSSSVPSPVPAPATKPSRRKDKEPHISMSPSIPSPPALDFTKLYESYQMMIDTSSSVVHATLPPPATAEAMDRMMRAATYGSHMLETAVLQQQNHHQQPHQQPQPPQQQQRALQSNSPKRQPPPAQLEAAKPPESESKPVLPNPKKTEEDGGPQEGQTCLGCNATSTPEWRRGPLGPRTLCNACGLVYAKLIKKRQRDSGRKKGKNAGGSGAAGGDESSEDSEHSSGRAGSEGDQKQNMRE